MGVNGNTWVILDWPKRKKIIRVQNKLDNISAPSGLPKNHNTPVSFVYTYVIPVKLTEKKNIQFFSYIYFSPVF